MIAQTTQDNLGMATVLVADDEPANVALLRGYLEAAGYQVMTAYRGEEALVKAFAQQPDLVLPAVKRA